MSLRDSAKGNEHKHLHMAHYPRFPILYENIDTSHSELEELRLACGP